MNNRSIARGTIRAMHITIAQLSLSLSIYIYILRLWCFAKHTTSRASRLYLGFKSPNSQSKLLNMISISKNHLIYIYIERERERLWCFVKHKVSYASRSYLEFESSNGRSKPLNIIFILKYPLISNYIFFWKFLLFFKWVQILII
jgi:hypothetical protein